MNSKECFIAACEHRNAERIPVDYLAHPAIDAKLKRHFGVEKEIDLLDQLGCDFNYLSCRDISQNECSVPFYKGTKLVSTLTERVCPFGIRWKRGAYGSKFAVDELIRGPLENVTSPQEILNHKLPSPADFDFSPLEGECESHASRVIIGGLWGAIFGDSYRMLGLENFLMNMRLAPDLIRTIVNRMTELYLAFNDVFFAMLKGKLDVWFFGNDFATQDSLMFSKEMWEDFFMEPIKNLIAHAHSYNLKVMMHSCGAITELIPNLIEAGVDILDPVQVSAQHMDIQILKERFRDRLVFHGGIDTQHILPEGTAAEVREHVYETIRVLGKDGGYIFAPSQILGLDIPVENIIAMYEAVNQKNGG